jgi:hypothetical protein
MPRQTFATREFFVSNPEAATHHTVLNLPQFFRKMQLTGENTKLHCITFLYAPEGKHDAIQVVMSILPLDEGCTKVTVHGSYTTGCAFKKDWYMTYALDNIEAAIHAAINGSTMPFEPPLPKKKLAQRCREVKHNTTSLIGNAIKGRRFLKPSHL